MQPQAAKKWGEPPDGPLNSGRSKSSYGGALLPDQVNSGYDQDGSAERK